MRRHIYLPTETRKKLIDEFGVSDSYFYDAMYFRRNGDMPQRLREAAIAHGGQCVDPDFVPNCRTEYLEGQIRQIFAAGVVLTIDRKTGMATITVGDDVVRKVNEAVRMSSWNILAQEAQQLAIQRVVNA